MANRIEAEVTVANIYEYEREAYTYGRETAYIYSMVGEDGTNYVWKTTSILGYEVEDPEGWIIREKKGKEVRYGYVPVNKDDKIRIKATVKGESEYKGKPQTEVNRVTVLERTYRAETYEERMERLDKEREAKKKEAAKKKAERERAKKKKQGQMDSDESDDNSDDNVKDSFLSDDQGEIY